MNQYVDASRFRMSVSRNRTHSTTANGRLRTCIVICLCAVFRRFQLPPPPRASMRTDTPIAALFDTAHLPLPRLAVPFGAYDAITLQTIDHSRPRVCGTMNAKAMAPHARQPPRLFGRRCRPIGTRGRQRCPGRLLQDRALATNDAGCRPSPLAQCCPGRTQ